MKEQAQQSIIPQQCPLCDAGQESLSYTPLGGAQQNIIHVTCAACGGKVLAFVSQNDVGIVTVGIATDLSAQEARASLHRAPVTHDDVLSLYATAGQSPLTAHDFIF